MHRNLLVTLSAGLLLWTAAAMPAVVPARPPVAGTSLDVSAASAVRAMVPGTRAAGRTVWVCRPGMRDNPCEGGLDTIVVAPDGTRTSRPFVRPARPSFDCFYVYPTVSTAPGTNAPLRPAPEVLFATRAQAAPFQSQCRLFVPAYRQITVSGLASGAFADPAARRKAQRDVERAFREYLRRFNDGRPFLLLGHSQGAYVLSELVRTTIDTDPTLLRRMVSAMLIGSGPWLSPGSTTRGLFRNVPPCRGTRQARCLVAYNSYGGEPPADAFFGRTVLGRTVVCVNPGDPAGGPALLDPVVPVPSAPGVEDVAGFVEYADSVLAQCRSSSQSTWLDVIRTDGSQLPALAVTPTSGPAWGLHRVDVTLALANLVAMSAEQAAALADRESDRALDGRPAG